MDQIKIGRFIAKLRKDKNMTQQQLGDKIGVSFKTISKWENGRGMPELSILKPLCEELEITVNEFLSGERIKKEDYQEKLEENMIATIDYSNRKINRTRKKITIILSAIGVIILMIISMFLIDVNCMNNNKSVVFSTWGFKYAPPIDLHEEHLELAITDYITKMNDNEIKHHDNEKGFVSFRTYLIVQERDSLYYVYAWVLNEKYYLENNEIKQDSGSSIPYKFKIEKSNNEFVVVDSRIPRDGSYYEKDMESIFPYSVRRDMENVHLDGTIERLSLDIQKQVKLYYHK